MFGKTTLSLLGMIGMLASSSGAERPFSQYLPADCALYFEAYKKEGLVSNQLADFFINAKDMALENRAEDAKELPLDNKELKKASKFLGERLVVAVGGEGNEVVGHLGELYQEVSAMGAAVQVEFLLSLLDGFQEGEGFDAADFADLGEQGALAGWDKFQLGFLLDSIVKENRLAIPSVYMAIRPVEAELEELWGKLDALKKEIEEDPEAEVEGVVIESQKWPTRGLKSKQDGALAAELREWWEGQAEEERGPLDEKRFEKLEAALRSLQFTVMWANVDGWLVFYAGNGSEGFQLADSNEKTMADDNKMVEVTSLSKGAESWMRWRVSTEFFKQMPSWLNDSPTARAQAMTLAKHTNLERQKEMTDALYEIAKSRSLRSRREVVSDWYGIGWVEDGLRIETVGGMRKPGLDYDAKWTLTGGVGAAGSILRAQWVGNESREKWGWEQVAGWVNLVGAGLAEWLPEDLPVSQEFIDEDLMGWAGGMIEATQVMNGEGLGDERAVAVDFSGEMPQVPGVSPKMLRDGRIPRILFARSVDDSESVAVEGKKMLEKTREFWKESEKMAEADFPFPGVMTSDENGLKTSFVLLPFSNDDFVPNVNLGEDILIYGTSRRQAQLFELGRKKKKVKVGSGFLLEVDLQKGMDFLEAWNRLSDSALLPFGQGDTMLDEMGVDSDEGLEKQLNKLRSLRYHHREEDGELRTSFKFVVK